MKKTALLIIKVYKRLKNFFFPLARSCRFSPTCSEYAYQAINKYGMIKGVFLSIKRLIRCHPGNKGGRDSLK